MILSITVIPMVGMFDAGLRAATTSSKYDQARALANENLEKVRALTYQNAIAAGKYPPGTRSCADFTSGSNGLDSCSVTTTFYTEAGGVVGAADASVTRPMMRIVVNVTWGSNSYTTTGFTAARGDK